MALLGKNNKTIGNIGLCIFDHGIHAVQFNGGLIPNKISVIGRSHIDLHPGIVAEGRIIRPNLLTESLGNLLHNPNQGHFVGNKIVLSLDAGIWDHDVLSIQKTKSKKFNKNKITDLLKHELKIDQDQNWDWQLSKDYNDKYHFYSAKLKSEVLREYDNVLNNVNAKLVVIEPNAMSVCRYLFDHGYVPEPLLLINIGQANFSIAVLDQFGIYQSELAEHNKTDLLNLIARDAEQFKNYYNIFQSKKRERLNTVVVYGDYFNHDLAQNISEKLHLDLYANHSWLGLSDEFDYSAAGAAIRGLYNKERCKKCINPIA